MSNILYSIKGRPKDIKKDNIPGPGAYTHAKSLISSYSHGKSGNNMGFGGKTKREASYISANKSNNIGPGAYSPKQEAVKYKQPTFGFGNSK